MWSKKVMLLVWYLLSLRETEDYELHLTDFTVSSHFRTASDIRSESDIGMSGIQYKPAKCFSTNEGSHYLLKKFISI